MMTWRNLGKYIDPAEEQDVVDWIVDLPFQMNPFSSHGRTAVHHVSKMIQSASSLLLAEYV
jgi:hypothetical protein